MSNSGIAVQQMNSGPERGIYRGAETLSGTLY